ncbi:unnamed protein product [Tuwongella immobilis]|uniref:Uncharacterized protein n=1 Tax=Tuwongella immobilis TaxID=692036 RepID=A0A6C2YVF2_9BACT|nr:unnamed protein product [Tuwongella immobilis]VTS08098.1 unnamed protein product [Tuwongella immobilis]
MFTDWILGIDLRRFKSVVWIYHRRTRESTTEHRVRTIHGTIRPESQRAWT